MKATIELHPGPRIGQPAPDFELPDQNGDLVSLKQFRGVCAVVLFFYPKDDTTGCTKEACAFRDRASAFTAAGARVFGISSDSVDSHRRFAAKYSLPHTLLSDAGGRVRRLYRVKRTFGIVPGRVTFVIDREGILRHEFSSQSQPERHVTEALTALG
jgi:peroxiredoxin Q/BCP